jgi:hypothetical protein
MRAGPNSPAHWIKLSSSYYTTACRKIISKEQAERVKIETVGLAGAPGQYVYRLEGGAEMCPECERKVYEQA